MRVSHRPFPIGAVGAFAGALSVALIVQGCAPSALGSARTMMRAGNYSGAHRELAALAAHPEKLSPAERREVRDDLCITEFTIGRPTYPLREQRRTCSEASAESGSRSGEILSRIDSAILQADDEQIDAAIKAGDLAAAEAAVRDYESIPGADQVQVARWSNRMWKLVEEKESQPSKVSKHVMNTAIATLRRSHADARKMSDAAFKRWILETATVDGKPIVRDPRLEHGRLKLGLEGLAPAALNLDKLAQINDAVVARCGCNARTDVGVGAGNMPAYVVRLDPEIRRSEVLILLSGETIGSDITYR
jgi:hypothetical protein